MSDTSGDGDGGGGGWTDTVGDFLGDAEQVANSVLNLRDRFRPREVAEQAPQAAPSTPTTQQPSAPVPQKQPAGVMDWIADNQTALVLGAVGLLALALILRATR